MSVPPLPPKPGTGPVDSARPASGSGKRAVSSVALLQGASELVIVHEGHEYRLRRTRQGKLLLTK